MGMDLMMINMETIKKKQLNKYVLFIINISK